MNKVLETLRHQNLLPSRIKDVENGITAMIQNLALAADEIERLEKENADLKKRVKRLVAAKPELL